MANIRLVPVYFSSRTVMVAPFVMAGEYLLVDVAGGNTPNRDR